MENYVILSPHDADTFAQRLSDLKEQTTRFLSDEHQAERRLQYTKIFLSDAQNQYQQLIESDLYQQLLSSSAITIVEQPPLSGAKIELLLKTTADSSHHIFQSLRLSEAETHATNSYMQTVMLFEKYIKMIAGTGMDLPTHLVRTWIYVSDIDVNYAGVVKARNDIFRRYGLTAETHFIASTGIGGRTSERYASVAIDFLTMPEIKEEDKLYLKALDHLNPTHEYGVAFERGTRVTLPDNYQYFISGTASIDKFGHVVYLGDVRRQTERLLENIDALLHDGEASLEDVRYFIVYLRDLSDYPFVNQYMQERFPDKPTVIVEAKVCRPQWLIEMECVASRKRA